jgi:hypothetical protein
MIKQEDLTRRPRKAACQTINSILCKNGDTNAPTSRRQFAAKNPSGCNQENRPFLTPAETAVRWRLHVETIRLWLRQRKLASVILARRRLIPVAEIQRIESSGLIQRAE